MSTKAETQEIEQEQEQDENQETGLVKAGISNLQNVAGFDGFDNDLLAELSGEISDTLKALSVTDFKGAKGFLGKNVALLDAFPFTMTEKDKQNVGQTLDVEKIMYVIADEHGEVHNVMQNLNAGRQRFITLYAKIKAANAVARSNRKLTLTNMTFTEVGQPQFGNKPIILGFTKDTQQVWSD